MANKRGSTLPEFDVIIHRDISEADNMTQESCPLCHTSLQLYQIHVDAKFLMCANKNCVYPFGISNLHVYKIECNEEFTKSETKSGFTSPTSGSLISSSDWSDLDKIMHTDGPFSPNSTPTPSLIEKPQDMEILETMRKTLESEEVIRKNVKKIKQLTKKLYAKSNHIGNRKWIEEINQMQELSGVQLLTQKELAQVKKDDPELKIDIDSSKNAISLQIKVKAQGKSK